MGFELKKVSDVVDAAVKHSWGIPEFQRGFVWNRQKVRDLVDSLWRGYPVGSLLLWYAQGEVEARIVADGVQSSGWLVDGQQRSTALCVLFGRKPYWWDSGWNDLVAKHDIRFNVTATEEPFFQLASGVTKKAAEWVPVRDVLNADDDKLSEIVLGRVEALGLQPGAFGKLYTALDRVRQIRNIDLPVVTINLDLEDVTEIFARLNSAGTKVTEADIALALAASQNPGWARESFLPFLADMSDAGFDVDPNIVFRSMVAIGLGKAVLRDVPKDYWSSESLGHAWKETKDAWQHTIAYIEQRGILSADVMPTKNALIPLVALAHRYPLVRRLVLGPRRRPGCRCRRRGDRPPRGCDAVSAGEGARAPPAAACSRHIRQLRAGRGGSRFPCRRPPPPLHRPDDPCDEPRAAASRGRGAMAGAIDERARHG